MNPKKLILLFFLALLAPMDAFSSSILLNIRNCNSKSFLWSINAEINVFKDDTFFKMISLKKTEQERRFSKFIDRIEHELNSLKAGTYTFYFTSYEKLIECYSIDLADEEKQELTICLDYMDYNAVDYIPFIDRLEEGDNYQVERESLGCFHNTRESFVVDKRQGKYFYTYHSNEIQISKILNDSELRALRKLEIDLKYFKKSGYCTTTTNYVVRYNNEKLEVEDKSCTSDYFRQYKDALEW